MGHKFNFDFISFNRDDIRHMSVEHLQKYIIKFRRLIREAKVMGHDPTLFEVEYCYLDHERQMRAQSEFANKHRRRERGDN